MHHSFLVVVVAEASFRKSSGEEVVEAYRKNLVEEVVASFRKSPGEVVGATWNYQWIAGDS